MKIWVIAFMAAVSLLAESKGRVFPEIESADLNKRTIKLPGDLSGDLNLILIAFQREQQADIDTWLKVLPEIKNRYPKLAYWEIPVIDRMNSFMRWFVSTGMRSGIPDNAQRARTVTLYTDKQKFKEPLGITAEDRIYVVVIDKKGSVLWSSEGRATAEKAKGLDEFLAGR